MTGINFEYVIGINFECVFGINCECVIEVNFECQIRINFAASHNAMRTHFPTGQGAVQFFFTFLPLSFEQSWKTKRPQEELQKSNTKHRWVRGTS